MKRTYAWLNKGNQWRTKSIVLKDIRKFYRENLILKINIK